MFRIFGTILVAIIMSILITPDYDKEQICYFCGKRHAMKKYAYSEPWYGIMKKLHFPIAVRYIKIYVEVPRCHKCKINHSKADVPSIILFFICLFIYAYLCIQQGGWTDHWYDILLLIFLDFIISLFVSMLIGTPIRMIINALFFSNCKDEEDTEEYEPIKRLRRIGFSRKRPDGLGSQSATLVKEEALNRILNDISLSDSFNVSQQD